MNRPQKVVRILGLKWGTEGAEDAQCLICEYLFPDAPEGPKEYNHAPQHIRKLYFSDILCISQVYPAYNNLSNFFKKPSYLDSRPLPRKLPQQ
jgi:hypothetical protein